MTANNSSIKKAWNTIPGDRYTRIWQCPDCYSQIPLPKGYTPQTLCFEYCPCCGKVRKDEKIEENPDDSE